MDKNHIAIIRLGGKAYSIGASNHALSRMNDRGIDKYVVSGTVIALGPTRIAELQENKDDAIIINENNNTSIVMAFDGTDITIITVIDKANIFVKTNTNIVTL